MRPKRHTEFAVICLRNRTRLYGNTCFKVFSTSPRLKPIDWTRGSMYGRKVAGRLASNYDLKDGHGRMALYRYAIITRGVSQCPVYRLASKAIASADEEFFTLDT